MSPEAYDALNLAPGRVEAAVYIMCGSVIGLHSDPLRRSATDVWFSLHEVFSDNGAMCVESGSIKSTDHPLPRLR